MNNKVIEVLDYLGQKLGIAIDWTAENVWPQVMDFMSRYQAYSIVYNCVWIVVCSIVIFACNVLFKKIIKQRKERSGIFWTEDELAWIASVFGCIALIVCIITVVINIFAITQWIIVPEMKFFEVISGLISSSN